MPNQTIADDTATLQKAIGRSDQTQNEQTCKDPMMALRDRIRIMVVDDTTISRGLIGQALSDFGVLNVTSAVNGEVALQMLADEPAHLIISDYHMPNMDGLTLLNTLRATPNTANIGFILLTGSRQDNVVEKGRALKMNNYLTKPFTPLELRYCIEEVVGRL